MTNIFSVSLKLMFLLGSLLPIYSSKSIYTGSTHAPVRSMVADRFSILPGVGAPPAKSLKSNQAGQRKLTDNSVALSPDPIRFSIQCDKRQITIDEEVNLTITAQLLNISPNQLFLGAGSNTYTLKVLLPPGFEQTGGDFVEYVTGSLSHASQPVMTYHIKGHFRSVTAGTRFRLLRSHGQANDQSLFAEKSAVTLQTASPGATTAQLRKAAAEPANPGDVTLFVMTDTKSTGSARAAAGNFQGFLDYAGCDVISGWIANQSDLRKSQGIDIYVNGVKAATIVADQRRQDVANALGVPDFNQYGYVWVIPDYYKANSSLTISVRPADTGTDLTLSPRKTAVCPGTGTPPTSTTTAPSTTTTTPPTTTPPTTTTTTPPSTTTTPPASTTPPATGGVLTMLAPAYNCATGAITFNTTGGDGTTIQYRATGITGWTTNPNQYLDAGSRVNADTPTFTIYFQQSGRVSTYSWSRQATCNGGTPPVNTTPPTTTTTTPPATTTTTPPSTTTTTAPSTTTTTPPVNTTTTPPPATGGVLTMLAPAYNCATGAITFNTTGGDGTPVQFMSPGITGWSVNPNQYLDAGSRVNADTPTFTIFFQQSGRVYTYSWSRQATCNGTTPPATTPPATTTPPPPPTTTPPPPPTTTPPATTTTTPPPSAGACAASINTVGYNWDGGNNGLSIGVNASGATPQIKLTGPSTIDWTNTNGIGNSNWFWANQNMNTGSYTVSVRQAGDAGAGCSFNFSVPSPSKQLYPSSAPVTTPPACTPPSAPTLSAQGGTQVCNNSTVTLTAAGCSGTVTWSGGQTGASISVNAAGTYTATCSASGCTSAPSNQLTVTACPVVTSSGQYNRILYVGNSITLHGGSPYFIVNAQNPARGMAATSPDKDYVRLMSAKFRGINPAADNRTLAASQWYQGGTLDEATGPYWEGQSTKDGIDLSRFDPIANWKPDIVFIRLGENVTDWEITNPALYQSRLKALIDKLISQSPTAKVVLSTSVWSKPNYDAAIRAVAAERNYPIADFSNMWPNRLINGYYSLGVTGDGATDSHPNDAGMAQIAERLWNATPK